jgi:glycosyltransferase involved in cell wall biosynthesis
MMAGVSVIICVRDGEAYLRDALDSVAAQDAADLETIVIDDGSADRSAEIARAHRVGARVVSRQASGQPAALNAGLELAGKDFIALLDSDDVWPQGRLANMLRMFDSDPGNEMVYGQMVNTNDALEPIQAPLATRLLPCSLVRRAVFARVGRFRTDVQHATSVDWMIRAATMKIRMAPLESVVLLRRVHASNFSVRDGARRDLLRIVREHRERSKNA